MDGEQSSSVVIVLEVLVALITHAWLKSHDPVPLSKAVVALAGLPILPLCYLFSQRTSASVPEVGQAYSIFYASLWCSVVAYRLSPFHPLSKYPGPIILKVTKLWSVWIAYTGKNHVYFKALHDKYGPTIRIGPNELSTIERDLIPEILGNLGMPRGPIWDGRRFAQTSVEAINNYDSLIDVRDSTIHAQLRKPWSKSFAAEPLQDYERLLLPRVIQLNQHLRNDIKKSGNGVGHVNIAQWINFFSFDFMGDLAFGTTFELMRDGDKEGKHRAMGDGLFLPSVTQHIPWFANLSRLIPAMNWGIRRLINLGVQEGVQRANKEIKHKDLFYHMGESADDSVNRVEMIISNVLLAIVAGSDTSSSVITNAVQLLISHPEAYRNLQLELDDAFARHQIPDVDFDGEVERYSDVLAGLKYLNGVINEALRLCPPVPTGLQRAPARGSGGKLLHDGKSFSIYLPEGNAICIPPYVLHRDHRYFSPQPNAFIPERWFSDSFETSRDAFIPFSHGPTSCVGRPLALIELRYALATLVKNFDMEFDTTKYSPAQWEKDRLDRFTMALGDLHVNIMLRSKQGRSKD